MEWETRIVVALKLMDKLVLMFRQGKPESVVLEKAKKLIPDQSEEYYAGLIYNCKLVCGLVVPE